MVVGRAFRRGGGCGRGRWLVSRRDRVRAGRDGPSITARGCGMPREFLTTLSFCLVFDVGGCIGDFSGPRCLAAAGWGKSLRTRLGRQNGCSRFSGTLLVVSLRLSVADVENDRFGTLVGWVRVRVLQARRKDPNRRSMGSWTLLFDAGSNSLMGDGGVT